jgi:hypothetical protein
MGPDTPLWAKLCEPVATEIVSVGMLENFIFQQMGDEEVEVSQRDGASPPFVNFVTAA